MSVIYVKGFWVDQNTGEILPAPYEVCNPSTTAAEREHWRSTSITAHQAQDPEQLKQVMKHTVDMRGVKVKSLLTEMKKESDYLVRTHKQQSCMSNTQYQFLKKLVKLVVYKNIILLDRAEFCKAIGVQDKHLARKLKQVETWVKSVPCRRGFVKLLVHPMVAYLGRASGISSAYSAFYPCPTAEERKRIHTEPFFGPPKPYTDVEITGFVPHNKANQYWDNRNTDFVDSTENLSSGPWWEKPPAENESVDAEMEQWWAEHGGDISDYYNIKF